MELTREHTVELLQKIAVFLRTHRALWSAHVVEFFQDRLWEHVDTEWWNDLRTASIEELLLLPSGRVRDTWCASLKSFISTAQSLALFRQNGNDFQKIFRGFCKPNISNVLKQGMNAKKLHEVEILSGVISRVFAEAHATHVVDVGAGQGYLAQVLAFEYGLPVVALDASSHHADVTSRRSARIEKHYAACSRKANSSLNTKDHLTRKGPQTATFCVMSGCSGKELQHFLSTLATEESSDLGNNATDRKDDNNAFSLAKGSDIIKPNESSGVVKQAQRSYILAGLHACGDLSAAVLKTYTMCEEVKAVVIVGCCYNLLTERLEKDHSPSSCFYGFPLSRGVRSIGLTLGRRACDLACQSAERWKDVGVDSALYNFEQHALRAGFQLVLHRYYPELAKSNPTIGRLGKARRRKQVKRHMLMNTLKPPLNGASEHELGSAASDAQQKRTLDRLQGDSKKTAFIEFCSAAVQRLGLKSIGEGNLVATWAEIESKTALVGAYWSLRAVLGPVLETFILLDRLLYLQEEVQCAAEDKGLSNKPLHEPKLIAVFDPSLSPRNMAIMAIKS